MFLFFSLLAVAAGGGDWGAFRDQTPVKRLEAFYASEGARIGKKDKDPKLTEKRLAEAARDLNKEEIRWLKKEALGKDPADERLFAAYLLALQAEVGPMVELALTAMPDSKKNEDVERSVRQQAVEGLARLCAKDPAARDALLDVVEKQADEILRELAHRGLYGCRGKPSK